MSVREIYSPSFRERIGLFKSRKNLSIIGTVVVILSIAATFALVQQRQDIRQRASELKSTEEIERQTKAMETVGFHALNSNEFAVLQKSTGASGGRKTAIAIPLSNGQIFKTEVDKTTAFMLLESKPDVPIYIKSSDNFQLKVKNQISGNTGQKIDSSVSEQLKSDSKVNVIIQFNTRKSDSTSSRPGSFAPQAASEYRSAKDTIARKFRGQSSVGRELKLIDGIAATVDRETLASLAQSSEIKRIDIDGVVHTTLDTSTAQIQAEQIWPIVSNGNALMGTGKSIAVLDTGVDYTHPSLGGCFGMNCKVYAGNDFINNDSDPMDDHGHGTHVAGTAAGKGVLRGIAPDAKILAVKVLDAGGSGSFSTILRGIEYAVDPNGDGNTSDHVDIINMSLGGYGNPDDVLSLAVDRATAAGVTVVVAAGNNGPASGTILTPGTARSAITVAASCKPTQVGTNTKCSTPIAEFSSRGPVIWQGANMQKPDVSAPGVLICASKLGTTNLTGENCIDQHFRISGTSMATPHVAGAAALILQAFPNYTPEQVKQLLKTTAKNLGQSYELQGAGEIQLKEAIPFNSAITSQPTNFTVTSDPSVASSVSTQTFTIASTDSTISTLSASFDVTIPGVGVSLSKTSLNPSSDSFSATVTVDNNTVKAGVHFGSITFSQNGVVKGVIPFSITIRPTLTFSVNTIDYGIDNPSLGTWNSAKKQIVITNRRNDIAQTLNGSVTPNVSGITYNVPSSVTIPANSSTTIDTSVTVANSSVYSGEYEGKYILSNQTINHSISTKFIKFYVVTVSDTNQSDFSHTLMTLTDRTVGGYYMATPPSYGPVVFYAYNPGPYDLLVKYFAVPDSSPEGFGDYNILKENIKLTDGQAAISISKSEAQNKVTMIPVTESGANGLASVHIRNETWAFQPSPQIENPFAMGIFSSNYNYLSSTYNNSISADYVYNFNLSSDQPAKKVYMWYGSIKGLQGNQTLTNVPEAMTPIEVDWKIDKQLGMIMPFIYHPRGVVGGYGSELALPLTQTVYSNGKEPFNRFYAGSPGETDLSPAFTVNPFKKYNVRNGAQLPLPNDKTLYHGLGPSVWMGTISYKYGNLQFGSYSYDGYSLGGDIPVLLRQDYGTKGYSEIPYTISTNGKQVVAGKLPAFPSGGYAQNHSVANGKYDFSANFAYKNQGKDMMGKVLARLDTTKTDSTPPAIKKLLVYSGGKRSEVYTTNTANKIEFEPDMMGGTVKSVTIEASKDGVTFQAVSKSQSGQLYTATLPGFSGTTKVTVRVTAQDNSDNSLSYTFELPVVIGIGVSPTPTRVLTPTPTRMPTPTPTRTPTPTLAPTGCFATAVSTRFSVACYYSNQATQYKTVVYGCSDGFSGKFTNSTCLTKAVLNSIAAKECGKRVVACR